MAFVGSFIGCSKDGDLGGENNTAEFNIMKTYEDAFITRFGQPAENQNWGFGPVAGTRSGNTSGNYEKYPATHEYTDASGKVIAGANMNHNEWADPDKEYGGWVVPDALTEGQKLRVKLYFQANPNLSYQDPHYANFFVQQVYTGGTSAPTTGNRESTVGADGTPHAGMTLNQLTVGQACSHINNFNAGTCTASSSIEVVDMRTSLTHCQLVQRHALMRLAISTNGRFLVASLRNTGATGIDLLHKEISVMWILVTQIGISLKIFLYAKFLAICQRIRN